MVRSPAFHASTASWYFWKSVLYGLYTSVLYFSAAALYASTCALYGLYTSVLYCSAAALYASTCALYGLYTSVLYFSDAALYASTCALYGLYTSVCHLVSESLYARRCCSNASSSFCRASRYDLSELRRNALCEGLAIPPNAKFWTGGMSYFDFFVIGPRPRN